MSKQTDKKKSIEHKKLALAKLETYIDELLEKDTSKSDKFCYWLEDYAKFLSYEQSFSPRKLKRYKRGEVVKAHLGFNIGSEEGGLHYCVVLDKNNNLSSPIITVIPLTSVKNEDRINKLHKGEVFIEDCLYNQLKAKYDLLSDEFQTLVQKRLHTSFNENEEYEFNKKFLELAHRISDSQKELKKMKIGSIALVAQITTISKIRIYDPKTNYDVLANIRLPDNMLDKIDAEITKLYTGTK